MSNGEDDIQWAVHKQEKLFGESSLKIWECTRSVQRWSLNCSQMTRKSGECSSARTFLSVWKLNQTCLVKSLLEMRVGSLSMIQRRSDKAFNGKVPFFCSPFQLGIDGSQKIKHMTYSSLYSAHRLQFIRTELQNFSQLTSLFFRKTWRPHSRGTPY